MAERAGRPAPALVRSWVWHAYECQGCAAGGVGTVHLVTGPGCEAPAPEVSLYCPACEARLVARGGTPPPAVHRWVGVVFGPDPAGR